MLFPDFSIAFWSWGAGSLGQWCDPTAVYNLQGTLSAVLECRREWNAHNAQRFADFTARCPEKCRKIASKLTKTPRDGVVVQLETGFRCPVWIL